MDAQASKHGIEIYALVRHAKPQLMDVEIINYGIAMCANALARQLLSSVIVGQSIIQSPVVVNNV